MDNIRGNEETIIDIKDLLAYLWRKTWIVILIGVIGAGIGFSLSAFIIEPKYESTTKIYLLGKDDDSSTVTSSDLQTGSLLTRDYMTLITSRSVVEKVITKLDLNIDYKELVDLIKVTNPTETRILNITVKYNNPKKAQTIANTIRDVASERITEVMEIDQVNVVDEANYPDEITSPKLINNTIMGLIGGIVLSIIIIFAVYFLDDTIKKPTDIEKHLGLSVLSIIPIQDSLKNSNKKKKEFIK